MDAHNYFNEYFGDGYYITAALGATILLLIVHRLKSFANVPPGPWGIPVFGYAPFLSQEPYKDFKQLSKRYGNLFSLQIGSRFVVILNSYDVINKAFKTNAFNGREYGKEREFFDNGIIVADGEMWRKQRRFLQSAMRDFGFGKSRMEEFIKNEILMSIDILLATKGKPNDVANITENIACNVIANFIFGQRFSPKNETLKTAIDSIRNATNNANVLAVYNSFPKILKYIPDWLTGLNYLAKAKSNIYSFVDSIIHEHKNTFDANNIRDLIDVYLEQLHGNLDEKSLYNDNLLRQNTMNLFAAGTHTSHNMISWSIRILAAHPDIQKNLQIELDNAIGRERFPLLNDRPNLPYTEAVILEIYRYVSLFPLTLYHRVTEEIIIDGYRIPKNTCALANIWNVHHTEDTWVEPNKFNPQRFLDKDGKLISTLIRNVIPFSMGKRNCVGESIAKMEEFLAVTILFQKFRFTLPDGEIWKFPSDYTMPFISCHKNVVCATPR